MTEEASHQVLEEMREALAALLDRADELGLHIAAIHIANAEADLDERLHSSLHR